MDYELLIYLIFMELSQSMDTVKKTFSFNRVLNAISFLKKRIRFHLFYTRINSLISLIQKATKMKIHRFLYSELVNFFFCSVVIKTTIEALFF